MPSSSSDAPAFTQVDWDEVGDGVGRPGARTIGFGLALGVLAALLAYDFVINPDKTMAPLEWDVRREGWLVLVSLVVVARYGLVPLVADRDRTARYVDAFRQRRAGVLALTYLTVFAVIGLVGPGVFEFSYAKLGHRLQPPVFASVSTDIVHTYSCVGPVVDGACQGTWQYPLGTNYIGENVFKNWLSGIHVAFKVGISTAVIMATVATVVGTVAGYYGGVVDDLLMRYVDIQQTVPAIVVYIILATLFLGNMTNISDGGLFAFALVFGLLDWGGIARLVRADAMQRRTTGYVRAAKAAGASNLRVMRRHVVPNSTATIVTALTRRIPLVILAQIGLAFLELNRTRPVSLGNVLLVGVMGRHMPWHVKWWTTVPAVLFLVGMVVSFNVFGDTVRDVLDPREEAQ